MPRDLVADRCRGRGRQSSSACPLPSRSPCSSPSAVFVAVNVSSAWPSRSGEPVGVAVALQTVTERFNIGLRHDRHVVLQTVRVDVHVIHGRRGVGHRHGDVEGVGRVVREAHDAEVLPHDDDLAGAGVDDRADVRVGERRRVVVLDRAGDAERRAALARDDDVRDRQVPGRGVTNLERRAVLQPRQADARSRCGLGAGGREEAERAVLQRAQARA